MKASKSAGRSSFLQVLAMAAKLQRRSDRGAQRALEQHQRQQLAAGEVPTVTGTIKHPGLNLKKVGLVLQAVAELRTVEALAELSDDDMRDWARTAVEAFKVAPDEAAMARAVYIGRNWALACSCYALTEADARARMAAEWDTRTAGAGSSRVRASCLAFARTLLGTRASDLDRADLLAEVKRARADAALLTPDELSQRRSAVMMWRRLQAELPDLGWELPQGGSIIYSNARDDLTIGAASMRVYCGGHQPANIKSDGSNVCAVVRATIAAKPKN